MSGLLQVLSYTADRAIELAKSDSVLGERIETEGMTVIPVSNLSVGFAGGGADVTAGKKSKNPAGAGAKITKKPVAFLVLRGSEVAVLHVAQDEAKGGKLIGTVVEQAKAFFAAKKEKEEPAE